jgi:rieske iron-sulfur protein
MPVRRRLIVRRYDFHRDRLNSRNTEETPTGDEVGEHRQCPSAVRRIGRRTALGIGICLLGAPHWALAQDDPKRERPREGDVLVKIGAADPAPLKAADLPLGGPQTLAWPMDPADKTLRDGTRLNKVLLLRLDPVGFDGATRERAADGVVAYSAICPHAGCDVTQWLAATQRLECPCHYSQYDPKSGAAVVAGPSPRPLPALPLKSVDGKLVVAKPFTGRVGFQQV